MRYFIAHIASKPLADYHQMLTKELIEKFGIKTNVDNSPAHITLKAPFETTDEEISYVKQTLQEITQGTFSLFFVAQGFGHFGRRIVTVDVIHSHEVEHFHLMLTQALKKLPFVKWADHEPIMHLHLTIAKGDLSEKFDEIWEYVKQKETPAFHCRLDNIALFRFENNHWVVDTTYALNP